jgi:hypothetical protein
LNRLLRILIYLIFLATCVEGLAVNIWYPSKVPYLFKDMLVLCTYLLLLLIYKEKFFIPSPRARLILQAFLIFSGIVLAYIVFPGGSTMSKLVAVNQRLFMSHCFVLHVYLSVRSADLNASSSFWF